MGFWFVMLVCDLEKMLKKGEKNEGDHHGGDQGASRRSRAIG